MRVPKLSGGSNVVVPRSLSKDAYSALDRNVSILHGQDGLSFAQVYGQRATISSVAASEGDFMCCVVNDILHHLPKTMQKHPPMEAISVLHTAH